MQESSDNFAAPTALTVRFKKTSTKKSNRRKSDRLDGQASDDEDSTRLDLLVDLREEQAARRRIRGHGTSSLVVVESNKKEINPLKIKEAGVDGRDELDGPTGASGVGGQSLLQMMDSQFKSGGEGGTKAVAHEDLMEAYVEEKLGLKAPGAGLKPSSMMTEEDELYLIPEDIKRKVKEAKIEFGTSKAEDTEGEIGQGAQIAWNTGIAEVDLPISVTLKNIEATKLARELLKQKSEMNKGNTDSIISSSLIGSYATNYSKHSKEYAAKMKERELIQMQDSNSEYNAPNQNVPEAMHSAVQTGSKLAKGFSNDDKVYERFKKRSRRF